MTIYRSKKGITAYCAKCRVKWHSDSTDYDVVENDLTRFQNEHAHGSSAPSLRESEPPAGFGRIRKVSRA